MSADLILKNGKIYSPLQNGEILRGSAVAVKDGNILAVAENDEEILRLAAENTEIIDCNGNTILPGLSDGHCHPSWSASFFIGCPLFAVTAETEETSQDVIDRYVAEFRKYADEHPEYSMLRGLGWNRAYFTGACRETRWPTRHDLDRISKDKPIILESYCQHAIWTNTKAIEMAGLTADMPNPPTGIMLREEDGYPSGIFMEFDPMALIKEGIPDYDFTVEQYKEALLKYQEVEANYYGVTLAQDCYCTPNAMEAYRQLAQEDKLTMRFRGVYKIDTATDEEIAAIAAKKGSDNISDCFQVNTIKIFVEGPFAMLDPMEPEYCEANGFPEGYCGDTIWPDEIVYPAVEKCIETGMQVHIHAMGDKAVRQAVRSLAEGQQKTGIKNRNIIAHLMAIHDDDLKLMGENDIMCALQPRWMVYDADMEDNYLTAFGEKRSLEMYANKKYHDAGCLVAYGTDYPVTPPPNPYHEIQCAITRSAFESDEMFYEKFKGIVQGPRDNPTKECVDLQSAVESLTINGAYQCFLEDMTGSIEAGKSAELVVLDCDIEAIPVADIHKIEAEKTIFKGKVVYSK